MSKLVVLPFTNPPSSGIAWLHNGLQNSGFIPKTYAAQGIGFAALSPFMEIWKLFRNFVFMIMVLLIIAIGFMIMFRTKINPQTVISIENALPRIVIALILITFSFAISGFLIDLMYIVIGFIVVLFSSNPSFGFNPTNLFNQYYFKVGSSPWDALAPVFNRDNLWAISSSIYGIIPTSIQSIVNLITYNLASKLIILTVSGLGGYLISPLKKFSALDVLGKIGNQINRIKPVAEKGAVAGQPVFSLIATIFLILIDIFASIIFGPIATVAILYVVLLFSLIFIYFRIFFMLLSVYINILLLIFFSPLLLAFEAFPGQSAFSSWLKNMLVNLATFPIVIVLSLIVQVLINTNLENKMLWQPPYLFSINPEAFKTLVAGFILFSIPDLVKTFKQLIGVKPLPLNLSFTPFVAGGQAVGGGALGLLTQFSSINLGLSALGLGGQKGQRSALMEALLGRGKEVEKPASGQPPA